ncbi:MAG: hypothetical protein IJQ84_00405 [Paludibacteraceae bacterium]|nr:hypothetical protein [Paludibacteraceae bacterium]
MKTIVDKPKFIDAFLNEGSYKHLNLLICAVASVFDNEVTRIVESWLNKADNLKLLAFVENVCHKENWNDQSESAYKKLLDQVANGNHITVNDWQNQTKGKSLLYMNGQYFANTYVAIAMCSSIDKEVWNILSQAITDIPVRYEDVYNYFGQMAINEKYSDIIPFICAKSFDDIKWFYEYFYGADGALCKRGEFFQYCIRYADIYLV